MEHRPIAFGYDIGETVLVRITNQIGLVESRTRGYWKSNEYDVIIPPENGRMRVREENLSHVPDAYVLTRLPTMAGLEAPPKFLHGPGSSRVLNASLTSESEENSALH